MRVVSCTNVATILQLANSDEVMEVNHVCGARALQHVGELERLLESQDEYDDDDDEDWDDE